MATQFGPAPFHIWRPTAHPHRTRPPAHCLLLLLPRSLQQHCTCLATANCSSAGSGQRPMRALTYLRPPTSLCVRTALVCTTPFLLAPSDHPIIPAFLPVGHYAGVPLLFILDSASNAVLSSAQLSAFLPFPLACMPLHLVAPSCPASRLHPTCGLHFITPVHRIHNSLHRIRPKFAFAALEVYAFAQLAAVASLHCPCPGPSRAQAQPACYWWGTVALSLAQWQAWPRGHSALQPGFCLARPRCNAGLQATAPMAAVLRHGVTVCPRDRSLGHSELS